jgi:hypothetical protein
MYLHAIPLALTHTDLRTNTDFTVFDLHAGRKQRRIQLGLGSRSSVFNRIVTFATRCRYRFRIVEWLDDPGWHIPRLTWYLRRPRSTILRSGYAGSVSRTDYNRRSDATAPCYLHPFTTSRVRSFSAIKHARLECNDEKLCGKSHITRRFLG